MRWEENNKMQVNTYEKGHKLACMLDQFTNLTFKITGLSSYNLIFNLFNLNCFILIMLWKPEVADSPPAPSPYLAPEGFFGA